jgi:uncharacterized membrane protein
VIAPGVTLGRCPKSGCPPSGQGRRSRKQKPEARELTAAEERYASAAGFEEAYFAVIGNCSMCQAREPSWAGILWAPKGVYLETPGDVARHASEIYIQTGLSHAMPPPNAIQMNQEARDLIVAWVREVRGLERR